LNLNMKQTKPKNQLVCFSFGLDIAATKRESSFNCWKASPFRPQWDHLVFPKHVTEARQWRTPQRRNRATLTNKRSIQTQQENLSRTTGIIYRYFQSHMQLQSCGNERQAVKLMVTLGAYGHDSDAYCIESSSSHVKHGSFVYQTALKDRCLTLKKVHNIYCKQVRIWLRVIQLH
jgi:hypothetical protein